MSLGDTPPPSLAGLKTILLRFFNLGTLPLLDTISILSKSFVRKGNKDQEALGCQEFHLEGIHIPILELLHEVIQSLF